MAWVHTWESFCAAKAVAERQIANGEFPSGTTLYVGLCKTKRGAFRIYQHPEPGSVKVGTVTH